MQTPELRTINVEPGAIVVYIYDLRSETAPHMADIDVKDGGTLLIMPYGDDASFCRGQAFDFVKAIRGMFGSNTKPAAAPIQYQCPVCRSAGAPPLLVIDNRYSPKCPRCNCNTGLFDTIEDAANSWKVIK